MFESERKLGWVTEASKTKTAAPWCLATRIRSTIVTQSRYSRSVAAMLLPRDRVSVGAYDALGKNLPSTSKTSGGGSRRVSGHHQPRKL